MGSCYLAIEEGPIRKALYPLRGETLIGRSPDNSISLDDPTVSRHHAKVSYLDGVWSVTDLDSANGIIFGGNRVDKMVLNSEDVFQVGETTFRFIEKEVLEGRDQLFQTLEILSSSPKKQDFSGEESASKSWKQQIQDTIETIPFFSFINEAERKSLMDTGTLYLFGPGESIIKEGDPGRSMYIILDGQVRLFTEDYEREELDLAVLGPSEFFGEISLLTGKPHLNSAAALENTVLMEFTHASMQELVRENPACEKTLSEYCHDRLAEMEKKRF